VTVKAVLESNRKIVPRGKIDAVTSINSDSVKVVIWPQALPQNISNKLEYKKNVRQAFKTKLNITYS
jgi:hypothetical protein